MSRLLHWIRQNYVLVLLWAGTLVITNWQVLAGQMFYTHDYLHGARIAEMARGLREGQFPVIWSQNFGFGFGMPLFEFYAPLPYFVGAIFYLSGLPLLTAVRLILALSTLGAAIGAYMWAREFSDELTASLAGSFLALASYRAMDLFARGAVSELWGIMAVPWLFAGITRMCRREKYGLGVTIFGGSVLALSHNITFMITAPLAVIYGVGLLVLTLYSQKNSFISQFFGMKTKKDAFGSIFGQLAVAGVTILGLTAFYWLPALVEKNYTQVDRYILGDYFDYHIHFLYARQLFQDKFGYGGSGWGPADGLSFFLGWAQWCGVAISTGVAAWYGIRLWRKGKNNSHQHSKIVYELTIFCLLSMLFILTIFMTLLRSSFIWDTLAGLLAFVQFPWRFLGVSVCMMAVLAVWGVGRLPRRYQTGVIITLWFLAALTSVHYFRGDSETMLTPTVCKRADENAACGNLPYYVDDPDYIRTAMSPVLVDYLPRDFANYEDSEGNLDWRRVKSGVVTISDMPQPQVWVDRMHAKLYEFNLESSREAELAVAYYPGWRVEVNALPGSWHVSERGNISVDIPAGQARVGLYLESTPVRALANWISFLTLIAVIGEGIYGCQKKK